MNTGGYSDSLQPESSKSKHLRTSTHKVRTGCITCKKRHIKCDEAKPHCSNCLRSRGSCGGYATQPRKNTNRPVEIQWDTGIRQRPRVEAPKLQLQIHPDAVDFRDATSWLYFQEFVSLVQGTWIRASASCNLWEVTIPQLARNDSILRPAAIAIGALSIWHRDSGYESLHDVSTPAAPISEKDKHYFQSIGHYCQSLKLQSQQGSPLSALLLSVLMLFFERLRGDRKAALDHVNHGLTLLLVLLTEESPYTHSANLAADPKALFRELANIFTHLVMQVRTILPSKIGQGSSVPNLRKVLLRTKHSMESFMTLMNQWSRSSTAKIQPPARFSSLDEFEKHLVDSRHQQTEVMTTVSELIQMSYLQASTNEATMDCFQSALLGSPRLRALSEEFSKAVQALDAAFLPLYNSIIMSDVESPAYMKAIHLRLRFLAVYVIDGPLQYLDIESVQQCSPSFREYISLVELALRTAKRTNGNPAYQLSLECELTRYLVVVALFCRDASIREHAVCVLRDYRGEDGLWNTHSLYAVALRNREVERKNASEGTPAEQWQRLLRREFVFEDYGDRVVFRYLDKDDGPAGGWHLVEEVADVGAKPEEVRWARRPTSGSDGILLADLYS